MAQLPCVSQGLPGGFNCLWPTDGREPPVSEVGVPRTAWRQDLLVANEATAVTRFDESIIVQLTIACSISHSKALKPEEKNKSREGPSRWPQ